MTTALHVIGHADIINKRGLHARAAAKFVKLSNQYECDIQVEKGDMKVPGRSIMGLMMLAASQGTQIAISAEGSDAEAAVEALKALCARRFEEDE